MSVRCRAIWPDTEAVRNDLLDYAFEIAQTSNRQLGKMWICLPKGPAGKHAGGRHLG